MSLASLVAAARSAVHLSEAAARAAEEATNAAKLASIHAKAALAASELAVDIEQKLKSKCEIQDLPKSYAHLGSESFTTNNTKGHNDNGTENINVCDENESQRKAVSSKEFEVHENVATGTKNRIIYDREYLLSFQNNPLAAKKPLNIAIETITKNSLYPAAFHAQKSKHKIDHVDLNLLKELNKGISNDKHQNFLKKDFNQFKFSYFKDNLIKKAHMEPTQSTGFKILKHEVATRLEQLQALLKPNEKFNFSQAIADMDAANRSREKQFKSTSVPSIFFSELLSLCENSHEISSKNDNSNVPLVSAQKFVISRAGKRITFRGTKFSQFSNNKLYWSSSFSVHALILPEDIMDEIGIEELQTIICDIVIEVEEHDDGLKLVACVENVSDNLQEAEIETSEAAIVSHFNDEQVKMFNGVKDTFIAKIILLHSVHTILEIYSNLLLPGRLDEDDDLYCQQLKKFYMNIKSTYLLIPFEKEVMIDIGFETAIKMFNLCDNLEKATDYDDAPVNSTEIHLLVKSKYEIVIPNLTVSVEFDKEKTTRTTSFAFPSQDEHLSKVTYKQVSRGPFVDNDDTELVNIEETSIICTHSSCVFSSKEPNDVEMCQEKTVEMEEDISELGEERMLSSITGIIVNIEDLFNENSTINTQVKPSMSRSNSSSQSSLTSVHLRDADTDKVTRAKKQSKPTMSSSSSASQSSLTSSDLRDPKMDEDNCKNCKSTKKRCRHGQPFKYVSAKLFGCRVASSGSNWEVGEKDKFARVNGGVVGDPFQVRVTWETSNGSHTYIMQQSEGQYAFSFHCKDKTSKTVKGQTESPVGACLSHLSSVQRLPLRQDGEIWTHKEKQKHRLLFRTSEHILLHGVSLLIDSVVAEIVISLCKKTAQDDFGSLYWEKFENVQRCLSVSGATSLIFAKPVPLPRQKENLLVLTLTGGSSVVGFGGRKYVPVEIDVEGNEKTNQVLFTFGEYNHKGDVEGQCSTIENGLVERFLFTLDKVST